MDMTIHALSDDWVLNANQLFETFDTYAYENAYLTDASGNRLTDASGNYLVGPYRVTTSTLLIHALANDEVMNTE